MKQLIIRSLGTYLNMLAFVAPGKAGKKGFLLFCRPFRTPITEKQKQFFNTADKSLLNDTDVRVQVYKWGNGPKKILFLHGWKSHSYRWKPYIEALSKDEYTIYALDAPGHGLSGGDFLSVPVYSSIIQQFIHQTGEFHTVIGHSVGSFSLLYTLFQYPLLPIRKIILLAPPGEATDFMDFYRKTLRLSDRTTQLVIDHFRSVYDVGPEYFSAAKFAASVNVPGLIIHDEMDDETPYRYALDIHNEWKRSKLITTRGYGHNLRSPVVTDTVVNYITEPAHETAMHR